MPLNHHLYDEGVFLLGLHHRDPSFSSVVEPPNLHRPSYVLPSYPLRHYEHLLHQHEPYGPLLARPLPSLGVVYAPPHPLPHLHDPF